MLDLYSIDGRWFIADKNEIMELFTNNFKDSTSFGFIKRELIKTNLTNRCINICLKLSLVKKKKTLKSN